MEDKDEFALSRARNDARTDVRNLLTQRAIQTFMFLCNEVRDPHSGKWIEDFLGTRNLLEFHGTGGFGGSWDGPLLQMAEHPKDVVVVSARRTGKGYKGWSKNNPYLEDRYVDFEIDINPVSLATRILTIREQIASEWFSDLDILAYANKQILESYFKLAKEEQKNKQGNELTPPSLAFERIAVNLLNNFTAFNAKKASSPFRKGNFDLLYNLCTQASLHRLLRKLRDSGESREISFQWLRDFYFSRLNEFFDGDQPYGRADDFIEELLLSSPSLKKSPDGMVYFADPFRLAEQIIQIREEIVQEWKLIMQSVPNDHASGIRKVLLNKQMEAWGSQEPLADNGDFQ